MRHEFTSACLAFLIWCGVMYALVQVVSHAIQLSGG